jgi:PAS domain-containing protein
MEFSWSHAEKREVQRLATSSSKSLRESEGRRRLAMSSGDIGFWDWDVGTGRTTWSREIEDIFGVDHAGPYEAFSSRVHPDDLAAMESERDAAIRNHKPFDLEFRIVLPSGEVRWLCSRGCGHYDENGHVVRVVGIMANRGMPSFAGPPAAP